MVATLVFFGSVLSAYGQGVGTDKSFAASIDGKQVSVEATLSPNDLDAAQQGQPTLLIRTVDTSNNATIAGIDYHVVVTKEGKTLLDQEFHSTDGIVFAKLAPDKNANVAQVNGQVHPGRVNVSKNSPVEIKSGIMSSGGLYKISVTLQRSTTGLELGQDQTFDLFVSVSGTQNFTVQNAEGSQKIDVKTYYADISSLNYDKSANSISFSMPFDWSPSYVPQVPVVHVELEFPKSMKELQVNSYRGYANGKELPIDALIIDDYSSEDMRIVHYVINNQRLTSIPPSGGGNGSNGTIDFALKTSAEPKLPLDLLSTTQKYLWELSWGPKIIASGVPTTFVMNIQNNQATGGTSTLVENAAFDFVITKDGQEVHRQHLTSGLGTFTDQYTFPTAGSYSVEAQKINGENESAKINVVVLQGNNTSTTNNTGPAAQPQQSTKPSGCLIATAAFGSELTPQVQFLRGFRDDYVLKSLTGSSFINTFNTIYYSFSPQVADYEREQPWLQTTVKAALYPLFGILMASEKTFASSGGGEVGTILAGAVASTLIGAVYISPLTAGVAIAAKKKIKSRIVAFAAIAAAGALAATLAALAARSDQALSITTPALVIALAGSAALAIVRLVQKTRIRRLGNNP